MDTYFNQQLCNARPASVNAVLPTAFQVGDEVDVLLDPQKPPLYAVVFAVRLTGAGTVHYDLAVPAGTSEFWAIVRDIRGSLSAHKKNDFQELVDVSELDEEMRSEIAVRPHLTLVPPIS